MTIQAIIFDLDNTLVNRKEAFRKFAERFMDQFVEVTSPHQRQQFIEYMIEADRDGYRRKQELYEELKRKMSMRNPDVTVDELAEYWFAEFFQCTVLMDGAIEVLEKLKSEGLKLGIITNGSVHSQNAKIDHVRIRDYFDVIVVSDEVGVKKPDVRIFQTALERLQVKPEQSWYIGDHPVNDIQGARYAGLTPVWLEGYMSWVEGIEKPRHVIRELRELMDIEHA